MIINTRKMACCSFTGTVSAQIMVARDYTYIPPAEDEAIGNTDIFHGDWCKRENNRAPHVHWEEAYGVTYMEVPQWSNQTQKVMECHSRQIPFHARFSYVSSDHIITRNLSQSPGRFDRSGLEGLLNRMNLTAPMLLSILRPPNIRP